MSKTICKPLTKQIFLPSKKRRPPSKHSKQSPHPPQSNFFCKTKKGAPLKTVQNKCNHQTTHSNLTEKNNLPRPPTKQIEADDFESRVAPRLQPNLSERSELCRLNLGAIRDSKQKRTLRQRKKRFLWFVSLSPQRNEHPPRHGK